MPKLKTKKAISERFQVKTSRKGTKILKRHDGQDHFNARQTGKKKRIKRKDNEQSIAHKKKIVRAIPYPQYQ